MKFKKLVMMLLLFSVLTICTFYNNITKAEGETEEKIYCDATIDDEFTDNEILIVLTNEESLKFSEYTVNSFSEINCIAIDDLTDGYKDKIEQQLNGTYTGNMPVNLSTFNRIFKLTLGINSKQYVLNSIKELEKRSDILSAEPNYILKNILSSTNSTQYIPNDEYFNTGANDIINLYEAWNVSTGANYVKVGIIDSGIDYNQSLSVDDVHPDLYGQVNSTFSESFISASSNPLIDNIGHGTMVAGIIGAQGGNGIGISGVCWKTELVSLKVVGTESESIETSVFLSNAASAINYAGINNIPILNCSFASTTYSSTLASAINSYSGLIICAAGNENINFDDLEAPSYYPACYNSDNIITVGALSSETDLWQESEYGSNYGMEVDILAPGCTIFSTYPVSKCDEPGCTNSASGVYSSLFSNSHKIVGYHTATGTSLATPFVTGTAALILSLYPNISPSEVRSIILNSANEVTSLDEYCYRGRVLDVYAAITYHNHNVNIYDVYDATYHRASCYCGYSYMEEHNWIYDTLISSENNQNAVSGSLICSKCGVRKIAGTQNENDDEDL